MTKQGKRSYGRQARTHHWCTWYWGYRLCATCGLLWLRNEASCRAANAACRGHIDD
jgi:hypothetical protein